MTALLLCLLLTSLTGCIRNRTELVHVSASDFMSLKSGNTYVAEQDGWFVSDEAMKEILKVKAQ